MLLRPLQCSIRNHTRYFFTNNLKQASKQIVEDKNLRIKNRKTVHYFTALGLVTIGAAYAAVPFYKLFCQRSSYGGTINKDVTDLEKIVPVKDRVIRVRFNSDVAASMTWKFKPQQDYIDVIPGETALVFYTATNPTDVPIIGISTYNVVPFDAAAYFNKIQCFCFEEQRLNPQESVDMPVFFYIDPEYANDPFLERVDEITLSYTFFEAKKGIKLPIPTYIKKHLS